MKNIIYILLAMLAISCGKDEIENEQKILINETISGNVSFENADLCCDVQVAIVKQMQVDTLITYDTLSVTSIDSIGNYKFNNVAPEQDDLFIVLVEVYYPIRAEDITPDGDEGEMGPTSIGVYLEENENDDGNNFTVLGTNSCMTTIRGTVFLSTTGMLSPFANQPMNLYANNNNSLGQLLSTTITDQNGHYLFETSDMNKDVIVEIDSEFTTVPILDLQGYDSSPEANEIQLEAKEQIHCLIADPCIADNDNNFIIETNPIPVTGVSGYVLIDTNNDGIGDEPAPGKRVELYHRTADNVPMTPQLGGENTDANGYFHFPNIAPGEYVLYYIGDGNGPELVAGYDEDQEDGEPSGPQAIFIPVNITSEGQLDDNNYYILSNNGGCLKDLRIVEYWALCDTSKICEYEKWPVACIDENGDLLSTVSNSYSLVWTDLLTGESGINDWIYANYNHPIQLTVTAPDGCEYVVDYHRLCDQDLTGKFYMSRIEGGLDVAHDYVPFQIEYNFSPFDKTVSISHPSNTPLDNDNLLPVGDYSYEITINNDEYEISVTSDAGVEHQLGVIRNEGDHIVFDDDVTTDGLRRELRRY